VLELQSPGNKLALAISDCDNRSGRRRMGLASAISSWSGWYENLLVAEAKTVGVGTCCKVPVLGRDGGLEDAETRLESKTKLLWNEKAIWSGEVFGGSDG